MPCPQSPTGGSCTVLKTSPAHASYSWPRGVGRNSLQRESFFVRTGASGLEVQVNGKTRAYALMVADTVLVKESGNAPEVLTSIASKAWSDVAYFLKVHWLQASILRTAQAWIQI